MKTLLKSKIALVILVGGLLLSCKGQMSDPARDPLTNGSRMTADSTKSMTRERNNMDGTLITPNSSTVPTVIDTTGTGTNNSNSTEFGLKPRVNGSNMTDPSIYPTTPGAITTPGTLPSMNSSPVDPNTIPGTNSSITSPSTLPGTNNSSIMPSTKPATNGTSTTIPPKG